METLFEIQHHCLTYLSNIIDQYCDYKESDWLLSHLDRMKALAEKIGKECAAEVEENIRWNNNLKIGGIKLPMVDTSNYAKIEFAWRQQFGSLAYSIRRIYNCRNVAEKYGFNEKDFESVLEEYYKNDNPAPFIEYLENKTFYYEVEEKANALYGNLMKIDCIEREFPSENASDYEKLYFAYIIANRLNKATNFLNNAYLFEKQNTEKLDAVIKKYLDIDANFKYSSLPLPKAPVNNEISFIAASLIGGGCGAALGIGLSLLTEIPLLILAGVGTGIIISSILRAKKNRKKKEIYDKQFGEYSKEKSEIEKKNNQAYYKARQAYYDQFSRESLNEIEGNLENLTFVLQSLTVACTQILDLPTFNFLPEKYKYSATVLGTFVEYFNDRRVSSIQEAVNLYISELRANEHREKMLQLEQMRLQAQKKAIAQQQKQEAERNRLLKQMTQTVEDIKKNEAEAEKQRQKDADSLKESLSNARKEVKETKDKLTDIQRETDNLKKLLKD